MSTLEALNAISEAIEAHKILPDVQRQLKEAREAHDFAMLELDEARDQIERLKAELNSRTNDLDYATQLLRERDATIAELRDRNNMLDRSLNSTRETVNNLNEQLYEHALKIESLLLTKDSLEAKLHEARGYGERLAETLRSIGASIVAAVEVPEVTSESPFPVSNPVAMPSPTDAELDSALGNEPNGNVAEPTAADLVGVAEDNSSSFNTPPASPGCYISPLPPAKLWWEN